MSTNHTPNYSLCQWEAEDKVIRTEFNADNAKIDAAIKAVDRRVDGKADASALTAEVNARTAAVQTLTTALGSKADKTAVTSLENTLTAVSGRAGSEILASVTLSAEASSLNLSLDGVDWSKYSILACYFRPVGTAEYNTPFKSLRTSTPSLAVLFPMLGLGAVGGFIVYGSSYNVGIPLCGLPSNIYYSAITGSFGAGTFARAVGIK